VSATRFLTPTAGGFTFTGPSDDNDAELGYTTSPSRAMRNEPEAITADELRDLTDAAQRQAEHHRRDSLEQTRARLQREADYHAAQLRHRQRQLDRLERRLTAR